MYLRRLEKATKKAQLYILFKDGTLKRKDNDKRIKMEYLCFPNYVTKLLVGYYGLGRGGMHSIWSKNAENWLNVILKE